MAITQIKIQSPANEVIFNDTSIGSAIDAIKASSAVLYWLSVDNTQNISTSYLKIFNVASGSITLGTTSPDQIIFCPAGVITTVNFFTGSAPGMTFATALSAACVTTGGTAGTTPPSSSVILTAVYV